MKKALIAMTVSVIITLACGGTPTVPPTPQKSVFDLGRTAYGFFPSPPEITLKSVFKLFEDMGEHGDFVLIQQNAAWADFAQAPDGETQTRTDITNQVILTRRNGLEYVFVLDALNGLNRREFSGLPQGWEASFANPEIRSAYRNYALWVVRSFHPRYLGLASEINTYMDAHPQDAPNFLSLYNEIYARIKAEAPETRIFVTFQWDDLNNMFAQPGEGDRQRLDPNWEQIEVFEPNLDLWAISSYPYFVFPSSADIPDDYYSPLISRTTKPLAIAEGGYTSRDIGQVTSTPEGQAAYLKAVHTQLGPRLAFWVNTLLDDIKIDSYSEEMLSQGRAPADILTLGNFAYIGLRDSDGSPKPALEVWDSFRAGE